MAPSGTLSFARLCNGVRRAGCINRDALKLVTDASYEVLHRFVTNVIVDNLFMATRPCYLCSLFYMQGGCIATRLSTTYNVSMYPGESYLKWKMEGFPGRRWGTNGRRNLNVLWIGIPVHHREGRSRARLYVRQRDKYTCQDCGFVRTTEDVIKHNAPLGKGAIKGKIKSLDVHHLEGMCGKNSIGYDSTKDISKLITLCHKCHFNRHDWQPRLKKLNM